jgi:phosphatidate cytidylyltransferase
MQMNHLKIIFPIGQRTNLNLMAFHLATFKTRAITAVVFALVMLVGLLGNACTFIILFTIIHFGCWYEFIRLMKKITRQWYAFLLGGLIYITIPILMMIDIGVERILSTIRYVYIFPCAIIFSIWINDTMAYVIGSLIGRTPFSPISPKKTWEGTVGGAILCVLVMGYIIIPLIYGNPSLDINPVNRFHWFVIAAICAFFGTLGDLLESKLKRIALVKDSGTLMPGHGGFLDRFDSLLIATPFVWLYVYFFMQ